MTADDFGADRAINEAVEEAHREGILSSASLLVGGAAAPDAVARARRLPGLAVGLHLAVVDALPTAPLEAIPGLLDRDGRLCRDQARAGVRFLRARVRAQLEREVRAQFQAFAATGLRLDHVNGHRHMHVHPTVAGLVLRLGRGAGVRAVRVPLEPMRVLARVEPGTRARIDSRIMRPWAIWLGRRARRAGLLANDHLFGVEWTGAMSEARVLGLLDALPGGLSELYFHPRRAPEPGGRAELEALTSRAVRERLQALGLAPTTFSALAGTR